jgi:hypothetical protein
MKYRSRWWFDTGWKPMQFGHLETTTCPEAEGAGGLSPGFQPISANLMKASAGRMYFVPEGQHDSSQARSTWSHEENCPVPAGRLNGSRLGLEANKGWIVGLDPPDFDRPSGTGALCIATQALRAWLLSPCPSGTKAIRPSKGLALS